MKNWEYFFFDAFVNFDSWKTIKQAKNQKILGQNQILAPGMDCPYKNTSRIVYFEKIWNNIHCHFFTTFWPNKTLGWNKTRFIPDFFKLKYFRSIFTQKVDSRCQKLYRMSIFIIFRTFFHFLKICRKLKCPRKKVFPIFQKWIVSRLFWAKFSEYLVKKSTGCKNLPENGV